jgi:hypothetical protein
MPKYDPKATVTNEALLDTLHDALGDFFERIEEMVDEKLGTFKKEVDGRFTTLEAGQVELGRKIDDLKADLADTPSRKEFETLRQRVDRLEHVSSAS